LVESKKLFLNNFAINANSQSSETLKNAIITKNANTIKATNIPNTFHHILETALNKPRDIATHIANINNCIMEIFIGHI
jgi:hypothetical protein